MIGFVYDNIYIIHYIILNIPNFNDRVLRKILYVCYTNITTDVDFDLIVC